MFDRSNENPLLHLARQKSISRRKLSSRLRKLNCCTQLHFLNSSAQQFILIASQTQLTPNWLFSNQCASRFAARVYDSCLNVNWCKALQRTNLRTGRFSIKLEVRQSHLNKRGVLRLIDVSACNATLCVNSISLLLFSVFRHRNCTV
jgi:hypothetical protein